MFSFPLPSTSDIYNIYKHKYFSSSRSVGYPDYTENRVIRIATFEFYFSLVRPYLQNKNSALDIGCADGGFLDVLKAEKFENLEGVELNQEMFEDTGQHFKLFNQPIETVETGRQYDLITLFDVLEHIPDLKAAASNIHRFLDEKGIVVILTPDYNNLQRKIKGKNWFQFKPEEHINYFTQERITTFLKENNFEVIHVSEGVSLVNKEFIKDRLNRYNYSFLEFLFSVFGRLFFISRKFIKVSNSSIFVIARRA